MRDETWKVGELSKATGLSVRTLHHYDEIGLLSPSHRTPSGHRLYGGGDVARLQQIVSLRELGFPLEQVRELLDRPDMSPQRVLRMHIERLREQVEQQKKLVERLEAVAAGLEQGAKVSAGELIHTIREIRKVEKYYTPEQLEELRERGRQLGEEGMRQAERDWQELMAAVRAEMDAGTDPADPRVQALAARWMELVRAFTGGNPEIAKSLNNLWQQEEVVHGIETGPMREMGAYVQRSVAAGQGGA